MPKYKETCCVNTSRNSLNFLSNRNWPNSAPTLVSRRTLREDSSSLHLMMMHSDDMKGSCREYTSPRSEESCYVRGWIRGNTKIGPVLGVKVCYHQGRYGVEIMIEFFISWQSSFFGSYRERNQQIRNRNVRINSCCRCWEQRYRETCRWRLNQDRRRLSCCLLCLFLYLERKWIDIQPGKIQPRLFWSGPNFMIRLLRHDETVHREDDGVVRFHDSGRIV